MQLKRGLVTYFGLNKETVIKNTAIYRPLLSCTKDDLISYCKEKNVPYSIDVTNADTTLLRNKIRQEKVSILSMDQKLEIVDEINKKNEILNLYNKEIENILKDKEVKLDTIHGLNSELKERLIFTWVKKYINKTFSRKRIFFTR